MKDPRCLIGRHAWETTNVFRFCGCDWPDVEQHTKVARVGIYETHCTAAVTRRCNRCSASRRLWARRRTPGNPPAWAHARTGGAR
ncbi:MAG: hypothetical protein M0R73_13985 [Dehalococcoidia bacterium]|nr:hypothetical protein [Dehalococcoidia bacterium]